MSRSVYAFVEVGFVLILAACAGLMMTAAPAAPGDSASQPGLAVQPTAAPVVVPTNEPSTSLVKPDAALPPSILFARPDGPKGIAVAYDLNDGIHLFTLPAGMLAADAKSYFAAEFIGEGDTKVNRFDPATGEESLCVNLDGRWELAGLSPTSRWLALTRAFSDAEKQAWTKAGEWHTELQIVDTQSTRTEHILKLDGNFEVETISLDGKSLFLVEHRPAIEPDHYVIRLYDLSREQLIADPLRSKGPDEVMAGYAWEGVASKDGKWLLTLYLSTQRNTAFVHTLNLIDKFPVCIDLPSGNGDFEQLKYYALSLAPNGRTLYAANAALGIVAEVNLDSLQLGHIEPFAPHAERVAVDPQSQTARSLISPDGKTLYFTSGENVWAYDTAKGKVTGPLLTGGPIAGLGLSPDGERLFVAGAENLLGVFDTATGLALR